MLSRPLCYRTCVAITILVDVVCGASRTILYHSCILSLLILASQICGTLLSLNSKVNHLETSLKSDLSRDIDKIEKQLSMIISHLLKQEVDVRPASAAAGPETAK